MTRSKRDITGIKHEIEVFRGRIAGLQVQADRQGGAQQPVLTAALEELHIAVTELLTNEEDMRLKQQQFAEMETRLRQERRQYEDLFEYAPDTYVATTPSGVIQEANAMACSLLQAKKELLIGKPLLVFIETSQHKAYLDQLTRLRTHRVHIVRNWPLTMQRGDGQVVKVSVNVNNVQRDSRVEPHTMRWSIREVSPT